MRSRIPFIIAVTIFIVGFSLVVIGFLKTNHTKDCQQKNQKYIMETYGTTLGPNFPTEKRAAMAQAINKNLQNCLNLAN